MTVLQMGKRKCDESCYNAKHIGCNCICHGKNHGLGLQHALDTASQTAEAINAEVVESDDDTEADK